VYEPTETLVGPHNVGGYVRGQTPVVNWQETTTSEPIPVQVNGEPFWAVKAIPREGTGVSFVAFVHAQDNTVIAVENDHGVRMFLSGELTEGKDVSDMGTEPIEVEDEQVITSTVTITQDGETSEVQITNETEIVITGEE